MDSIDTNMRTEFEKWYSCCANCPSVTRNGFGYKLMQTNISWNAWQAAWQTCYARHGYKPMGDAVRGNLEIEDCHFSGERDLIYCTCHPSERPAKCQRKYALSDCIKSYEENKNV